ncbi:MAG: methionyl-tRNA formyltransferase [Lachnospiraceae bacterium]
MRIIFMGTPEFAVPVLESLVEGGHDVIAVVTQPDKQKGRGKAVQFPPVKQKALEYHIPIYQPLKARNPEFIAEMQRLNPDAMVVVAFGQILPKDILDIPKYGCINVHASLLPKYRGAAPMQWCIIDGETETGITTMMMDVGLDTGDMLKKEVVPIDPKETGESLHDKLAALGGPLTLKTLAELEAGTLKGEKQQDELSCYAKRLTKELGNIDWNQSASAIERLIRGLNSWPSAYTQAAGKTLKIWSADVLGEESGLEAGCVAEVSKDGFTVQTGQGMLAVKEVQLEGKKRMDAGAFLRGFSLEPGMKLGE